MLEFNDLRIFEAVARAGAMNRAAQNLNTVQSNVTQHVRQLEARLGVRLFDRHARGVTLTAAGHRLLPFADAAGRLVADACRAAADDGVPSGGLTVGSLETTAAMHLSPSLTAFARAHPEVDLTIRAGTTCELLAMVLAGEAEGAFVCGPVEHPELIVEAAYTEELVAVTADHVGRLADLTSDGTVRIAVLREGCSYRQRLEKVLASEGVMQVRVAEYGTLEMIIACVGAGMGMTLLPRALVREAEAARQVRLHKLANADDAQVETLFVRRRDAYQSSAMAAFLALLNPVSDAAE